MAKTRFLTFITTHCGHFGRCFCNETIVGCYTIINRKTECYTIINRKTILQNSMVQVKSCTKHGRPNKSTQTVALDEALQFPSLQQIVVDHIDFSHYWR